MAAISRTLLKSPPELWTILDNEGLMRRWLGELIGEPVDEVTVNERQEAESLSFSPAATAGFRGARIDIRLSETAFGTRVSVSSEFEAAGWVQSARRSAEDAAEARMESLLDHAVKDMATPQKRPFTAV